MSRSALRSPRSSSTVIAALALALTLIGLPPTATAASPAPAGSQDGHACEMLPPDLLFEALGTEPGDYDRGVYDEPSYWACSYTWVHDGAASQVTFAISKLGDQEAEAVYRASVEALVQSQDHRALDDLGDEAVWIPGVPQLSLRQGDDVFHLSVVHPADDGDGLQVSRRLAERLLARMN